MYAKRCLSFNFPSGFRAFERCLFSTILATKPSNPSLQRTNIYLKFLLYKMNRTGPGIIALEELLLKWRYLEIIQFNVSLFSLSFSFLLLFVNWMERRVRILVKFQFVTFTFKFLLRLLLNNRICRGGGTLTIFGKITIKYPLVKKLFLQSQNWIIHKMFKCCKNNQSIDLWSGN